MALCYRADSLPLCFGRELCVPLQTDVFGLVVLSLGFTSRHGRWVSLHVAMPSTAWGGTVLSICLAGTRPPAMIIPTT